MKDQSGRDLASLLSPKPVSNKNKDIYNPRLYWDRTQKNWVTIGEIDIAVRLLPFKGASPYDETTPLFIYKPQHKFGSSYTTCNSARNEPCPICDSKNKKISEIRPSFIVNVLILKDTQHPELEGRVMLYQCEPDVMECIGSAIETCNPFDVEIGKTLTVNILPKSDKANHINTIKWIESTKIDDVDRVLNACYDFNEVMDKYVHTLDEISETYRIWGGR